MILSKPHVRMHQAAMRKLVNVLSPVIFVIVEADAFHNSGRLNLLVCYWQEQVDSIGVLGSCMMQKGCAVNLGEPLCSYTEHSGEYVPTSQQRQGRAKGTTAVGSACSTPRTGKPCTWGRGRRGEAGESTLGFLITPRVA
jgi:hypothetical protein